MRRLPRFAPIQAPGDMDPGLKDRLMPLALATYRTPVDAWESQYRRSMTEMVKVRRGTDVMMKGLAKWSEATGRPITSKSVIRFMEVWDQNGAHVWILLFRDVDHARKSVLEAVVSGVMQS